MNPWNRTQPLAVALVVALVSVITSCRRADMTQQQQTFRIPALADSVVRRDALIGISQRMLQRGATRTYANAFNNNPFLETEHFELYLNPDPVDFNNRPVKNINCVPGLTGFHTLVLYRKSREPISDQYRFINFLSPDWIEMKLLDGSSMSIHDPWASPREAIQEALAVLDATKSSSK